MQLLTSLKPEVKVEQFRLLSFENFIDRIGDEFRESRLKHLIGYLDSQHLFPLSMLTKYIRGNPANLDYLTGVLTAAFYSDIKVRNKPLFEFLIGLKKKHNDPEAWFVDVYGQTKQYDLSSPPGEYSRLYKAMYGWLYATVYFSLFFSE